MQLILRFLAGISLVIMMIAALIQTFGWLGLIGYLATATYLTVERIVADRVTRKEQALRDGSLFRSTK